MGRQRLRVYLAGPDFLPQIQFRNIPEQNHFIVEPGSPVIELDRCYFDGTIIRAGRLYFYTGPDFNSGFVKWADRILRAARKALIRRPHGKMYFYYGPATLAWMELTGAHVRPLGLEVISGAA